jgi:hypothetical protein
VRHLGPPAPSPAQEPGPLAFGDPDYIRGVLAAAGFAEIAVERAHPTIIGRHARRSRARSRDTPEGEPGRSDNLQHSAGRTEFAQDSSLEEGGFELMVSLQPT